MSLLRHDFGAMAGLVEVLFEAEGYGVGGLWGQGSSIIIAGVL